jgi:competence protein ComEA
MPADDVQPPGGDGPPRLPLRPQLTARFPATATLLARRPAALVAMGLSALVVAASAWWFVRPAPHPPIETILPLAAGAASGASAPAGSPAAASAPAGGTTAAASLVVHVVGAVRAPGVVRLAAGSRALDAVAASGGLLPDADVARINLAARLVDGQRVLVPRVGEPTAPPVLDGSANGADGAGAAPSVAAPLHLNDATEAQLDQLPGVGPATAAAIVAHRTANGPFRSVDGLADVRGIGPAKLEQLRPLVTVS